MDKVLHRFQKGGISLRGFTMEAAPLDLSDPLQARTACWYTPMFAQCVGQLRHGGSPLKLSDPLHARNGRWIKS